MDRYLVTKEIEFDYGHRIQNHNSKCKNLHGHRGKLIATWSGDLQKEGSSQGMVVDFGDLKAMLMQLHDLWDHGLILEQSDPLLGYIVLKEPTGKYITIDQAPTAENLAMYAFVHLTSQLQRLHEERKLSNVLLEKVEFHETPTSSATIDARYLTSLRKAAIYITRGISMNQKTLCFCPAGLDACALWRMFFPHLHVPGSRFMFTGGMPPVDELCESDVIVCQRMMTANNLKFIQMIRAYGMRIVYDLDDNVWKLPKANPAYHIFKHQDTMTGMLACAEWADVLTVSTPTLKKVMEKEWGHLKNVATKKDIPIMVCENRVDPIFYKPNTKQNDRIVIGWAGSNTHAGDLADIWPVLLKVLNAYENVEVNLVGHQAPFQHPRLSHGKWVHISEFAFALRQWNWDIFLAPLETNKFNLSKSNIKMQEAGALGKPCLASRIQPYEDFCKGDYDLRWQLCDTSGFFERRLRQLIEDTQFRLELGNKMYNHTLKVYDVNKTTVEWEAVANACF